MKKIIAFLIRFVPRKYLQRLTGVGRWMFSILYAGSNVTCPVCEKSFRSFLPYGRITPRDNALCPNCLSLERHRLVYLYLKEKTNFFHQTLSVLHIAPELCFIKRFEKQHGDNYITADLESPLAKVKMDIHAIPFDANTFDVVLCNHVLEHVQDDIQSMSEIHRVLKPGGFAILMVPLYPPLPDETFADHSPMSPREREQKFGQADHVRKFGKDYTRRIEQAGLHPIEDRFASSLGEENRKRYGIFEEVVFVGRKN
jgi:SAM-dependent methyltransferase